MPRNSLSPHAFSPLALCSLLPTLVAQTPTEPPAPTETPAPVGNPAPVDPSLPAAAEESDPRLHGLPAFLRLVPGGTVEMGLTAEALIASACQVANPFRPKEALRQQEKLVTAMRRAAMALGQRKIPVDTFLLATWPVTNAEYEAYVAHRRSKGEKVRPPFAWWRYGRKDDYDTRIDEIARQFPKDAEGPYFYWEQHGHELPYALVDENGKSIADLPVTTLTYRDAMEFAAWSGMRLPTEVEWTRAARGDGHHRWPWGIHQEDIFNNDSLGFLGLDKNAGQQSTPVGTVQNAAGPYGHQDMFGRVWQFVAGLGFSPISGREVFEAQWKLLQKDKIGALLQSAPSGKDDRVVAKGGSFLSWQEPMQLLIDNRVPLQTNEPMPAVGLRLAKSLKPGFDVMFSMVRGQYNRSAFQIDQQLEESAQVGAERYELNDKGFPTAYQAVSFMPVNWLTNDKSTDINRLLEKTYSTPLLLGALVTTVPALEGKVAPGLYSVAYRKAGMPRELAEAIKTGHKELLAAKKNKPKEGETKPEKQGKETKASWRDLINVAGLTEEDLEAPDGGSLKFIRIDGVQVSTEEDSILLLSGSDSKLVASFAAPKHKPSNTKPFANELLLEKPTGSKTAGNTAMASFRVAIPLKSTDQRSLVEFQLQLPLDVPPPSPTNIWRLPGQIEAANGKDGAAPAQASAGKSGAAKGQN